MVSWGFQIRESRKRLLAKNDQKWFLTALRIYYYSILLFVFYKSGFRDHFKFGGFVIASLSFIPRGAHSRKSGKNLTILQTCFLEILIFTTRNLILSIFSRTVQKYKYNPSS
jgi:hypothetical protein